MVYALEVDRRERKRQAVHQRLLTAAQDLFQERGVSRTTVDDIADSADVARQTVFNHFPYKEALAIELGADALRQVANRVDTLLQLGSPALEVLKQAAEWILETSVAQGELAVVMACELLHPEIERSARASRQLPLQQIFEAILVQGREEGTVRRDLPVDLVACRVSAILTGLMAQVLTRDQDGLRHDLAICFDILFNGITERSR